MKSLWQGLLVTAALATLAVIGPNEGRIGATLLAATSSVQADDDRNDSIVGTRVLTGTLAPGFINTELSRFNAGGTWTTTSAVFNAHSSQNPFLPPFLTIDTSNGHVWYWYNNVWH